MRLRQLFRGAGFFGLTIGAGTAVFVGVHRASGVAGKGEARDRWSSAWSRGLLRLFGVTLEVHGDVGRDDFTRGRVVVSNHRSIIDIAVLLSVFGGAFIARKDLEGWPILGPAARSAGTIFVDRGSKQSGSQAVLAMVERLLVHDTVCVFPEGTTYVDDAIRPFKLGAFVAAERAQVPVIPVAIVYPKDSGAAFGGESFGQHLARLADTKETRVHLEVGDALTPGEGETVEAFAERTRLDVERLLARGRNR